ncbi:uncharacterized protein DS421_17g588980 [Arachis hypogaea]|nr:uncharacterized protein DS421_17g588980 [Arachis hypogaea]
MDERRQSTTKNDEQTSETVTVAHDEGGHNDREIEEAARVLLFGALVGKKE